MTMRVPSAAMDGDHALDLGGRAPGRGSPWARRGRGSRGSSAQARASARRCCSPPERTRAGRCGDARKAHARDALRGGGACARAPSTPFTASAYSTLASAERRSITGRWKTIACAWGGARPPQSHGAGSGRDEAVQRAQQHALARAVGAQDDGAQARLERELTAVEHRMARRGSRREVARSSSGRGSLQPWRLALHSRIA